MSKVDLHCFRLLCMIIALQGCFNEANFDRLVPQTNETEMIAGRMDTFPTSGEDTMSSGEAMSGEDPVFSGEEAGEGAGEAVGGGYQGGDPIGGSAVSQQSPLLGVWISSGEDVAPLLSEPPARLSQLTAEFKANGELVVQVVNQNGENFSLVGSYLIPEFTVEGMIYSIEVNQSLPDPSTTQGIWRVEDEVLTYEVVQVDPPLPGSNSPPTVSSGFGSTNRGDLGSANIQIYRRVR